MLRDLASLARKTRFAEREPSSALQALSASNSAVLHPEGTRVRGRNEICSRSGLQAPLWRRLYILDEAAFCRLGIVSWLGDLDSNQDWRSQCPTVRRSPSCLTISIKASGLTRAPELGAHASQSGSSSRGLASLARLFDQGVTGRLAFGPRSGFDRAAATSLL